MAGHYPGTLMTGHIGTNTPPNLRPLAGDDHALTLLKRVAVQIRSWVWSALTGY